MIVFIGALLLSGLAQADAITCYNLARADKMISSDLSTANVVNLCRSANGTETIACYHRARANPRISSELTVAATVKLCTQSGTADYQ
jgi:hypothetical protein